MAQVSYSPGTTEDWLGLFLSGAADGRGAAIDWKYLNDQQTPPASWQELGSVGLASPLTAGLYEVRLYDGNGARLAVSSAITSLDIPTMMLYCEEHEACVRTRYLDQDSVKCDWYFQCVQVGGGGDPPPDGGGGPPPSVEIISADIVRNEIVVRLSPAGRSGLLTLQAHHDAGVFELFSDWKAGGEDHGFSFRDLDLPAGSYHTVTATWEPVGDMSVVGARVVQFKVLGDYRQSQYNTPKEANCSGAPADAVIYNEASCAASETNLRAEFIPRAELQGNGITIEHGLVQRAWFCAGNPPPSGHFTIVASLKGPTGLPVADGATVAKLAENPDLELGDDVKIVGIGVKKVTDLCPVCAVSQLDNYTNAPSCENRWADLTGTPVKTIRLR